MLTWLVTSRPWLSCSNISASDCQSRCWTDYCRGPSLSLILSQRLLRSPHCLDECRWPNGAGDDGKGAEGVHADPCAPFPPRETPFSSCRCWGISGWLPGRETDRRYHPLGDGSERWGPADAWKTSFLKGIGVLQCFCRVQTLDSQGLI